MARIWKCKTPGCDKRPVARGLCRNCYNKEWSKPDSGFRKYEPYRPKWAKEGTGKYLLWFVCQLKRVPCPTYPELGECLEWQKARDNDGYGLTSFLGKHAIAHRIAFLYHRRRWPRKGLEVMHICDNPPCCNPQHLQEGTHGDNVQDMIDKGRQVPKAWTDEQAEAIIKDLRGGRMSLERAGKRHGGNVVGISASRHGKGPYAHLQHLWGKWASTHGNRKFSFEQAEAIRAEVAAGAKPTATGRKWGTSGWVIGQVIRFENAYESDRTGPRDAP